MNKTIRAIQEYCVKSKLTPIITIMAFTYAVTILIVNFIFWGGIAKNEVIIAYIVNSPLIIILLIPPSLILFLFFKFVKSKILRILCVALIIPFFNILYFFLDGYLNAYSYFGSLVYATYQIICLYPALFFVGLVVFLLKAKYGKETMIVSACLFFSSIICELSILPLRSIIPIDYTKYWNPITISNLEDFRPVISYLDDCKRKHGKYPLDLNGIEIKSKNYIYRSYTPQNNQQDYIFKVSDYKYNEYDHFRYCSSDELEHCKPTTQVKRDAVYKIGDWLHYKYLDD